MTWEVRVSSHAGAFSYRKNALHPDALFSRINPEVCISHHLALLACCCLPDQSICILEFGRARYHLGTETVLEHI
jgi:hypothetical protein